MTLVPRAQAVAGRVTRTIESGSPFWWVAIPLLAIYVLTPSANPHIDAFTNAITGWHIGMIGSAILQGYEEATVPENRRNVTWIEESPRGPVSQYPPGAAALSAPFYRLLGDDLKMVEVLGTNRPDVAPIVLGALPIGPARLTVALRTAAAMGFVALSIVVAGGTKLGAVAAGLVGGLATSMWAVAPSGIAFGAAIITRPQLAVIVAASRRDRRPLLHIGLGSMSGLGGLLWFNWWVWGRLTALSGYGPGLGGTAGKRPP
jgi:hypothetical protein